MRYHLRRGRPPEDGWHPISYWTKKNILAEASGCVPRHIMDRLKTIPLEDLRSLFLTDEGVCLCGHPKEIEKTCHARYYSLDTELMIRMWGAEE